MFELVSMVAWVLVVALLWRQSRRLGHISIEAWVFIGATSVFWLEAPWNVLLGVRYNHEAYVMMFPESWPVLGMAGGLPVNAVFIYGLWFLGSAWAAKKLMAARGWSNASVVLAAIVFGGLFEMAAEILFFILPERYAYTHVIEGMGWSAGTAHQYPLDVPLWLAPSIAACCLTLLRAEQIAGAEVQPSAQSETWFSGLNGLRAFGGTVDGPLVNTLAVVVVSNIGYMLTMLPATAIYILQWRNLVGDPTPFGHLPW